MPMKKRLKWSRAGALLERVKAASGHSSYTPEMGYELSSKKIVHRGESGLAAFWTVGVRLSNDLLKDLKALGTYSRDELISLVAGHGNYVMSNGTLMDCGAMADYHDEYDELPFSPVVSVTHPAMNDALSAVFKRNFDFPVLNEVSDWQEIVKLKRRAGYEWHHEYEDFVPVGSKQ